MHDELESDIRIYAAAMENLPQYTEWLEVTSALVYRDGIHRALELGEVLSPEYEKLLAQADENLLGHRDMLIRRFPEVFMDRGPREYWWWHLEKGPQVRAEALAAAQRRR